MFGSEGDLTAVFECGASLILIDITAHVIYDICAHVVSAHTCTYVMSVYSWAMYSVCVSEEPVSIQA